MNSLSKTVNKVFGYIFGLLVIAFTAINTFTLLYEISDNALLSVIGLILFEGGMLYWLSTFTTTAEGLPQMAIALLLFVACLVMVAIANAIELGAISLSADSLMAQRLIVLASLLHLIGKTIFPLLSPAQARAIYDRALEGKIVGLAHHALGQKADMIASNVADRLSEQWTNQLLLTMGNSHNIALGNESRESVTPVTVDDYSVTVGDSDTPSVTKKRKIARELACKACGEKFTTTNGNAKFCSDGCRVTYHRNSNIT